MFVLVNTSSIWPIRPQEIYNTTQLIKTLMKFPELKRWWIVLLILMAVLILSCFSACCLWCLCRPKTKKIKLKPDDTHPSIKYSRLQLLGNSTKTKVQPDVVSLGKLTKRELKIFT